MKKITSLPKDAYIGIEPTYKRDKYLHKDLLKYIDTLVNYYDNVYKRCKQYRDACANFINIYNWCDEQRNKTTDERLKDFIEDCDMIYQDLCDRFGPFNNYEYDWVEWCRNDIFIPYHDFKTIDTNRIKRIIEYKGYVNPKEHASSMIMSQVEQIYDNFVNKH